MGNGVRILLKKWKKKKRLLAGLTLSTMLLGSAGAYAAQAGGFGNLQVGEQAHGAAMLPDNQLITPAGKQIQFGGNPMTVAVNPNGKTAVTIVGRSDYGGQGINVIDLANGVMKAQDLSLGLSHMWGL